MLRSSSISSVHVQSIFFLLVKKEPFKLNIYQAETRTIKAGDIFKKLR